MGGGFVMGWSSQVPRLTGRSVGAAMNAIGTVEPVAPEGMGVIVHRRVGRR